MPNKTLWISDNALPIWDAADRVAKRQRTSLSRFLTELLAEHLPEIAAEPTPEDRWGNIAADQPAA